MPPALPKNRPTPCPPLERPAMYSSNYTFAQTSEKARQAGVERLAQAVFQADAIVVGAGSGLSTAAGLTYSGERFERNFFDFHARFGITDMYSGGFFPFPDAETSWAWWSRNIMVNRYVDAPGSAYRDLLAILKGRDYFVLTTNVDHQFQRTGFDKSRLFYTQGDYGLFQCSKPCHAATYDNEQIVREMYARQRDMRVPSELVPHCPKCGAPMTMNLRCDDTFVQDDGWYRAQERYREFLRRHEGMRVLFWELGVGGNTPVIIKYPFWRMCAHNPRATYACVNLGEALCPTTIERQSILLGADIAWVLGKLAGSNAS